MDTIEQRVLEQIELWSDQDEIKLTDDLLSVLSKDFDIDLIATMIEVEFGFEILSLDEDIKKVKSIADLVSLVKSKLNGIDYVDTTQHKDDTSDIQPAKADDKKAVIKSFQETESETHPKLDCEILMQAAVPDIYRINAFRISGLDINATTREISNQIQKNQMLEKYGGKMDIHKSPFPIEPPPDIDELRQALHRLRDPETRIIDEFFWFWPQSNESEVKDLALDALARSDFKTAENFWTNDESTSKESYVSRHNLSILSHLLVLDSELNGNSRSNEENAQRDKYWKDTFKRWKHLLEHEDFWSSLTSRVRQMDDPRLTTGFVKRMRDSLPYAILKINASLALKAAETGDKSDAERQIELMRNSGFGKDVVAHALRNVANPLRTRIKVICHSACDESDKNNIRAIEFARQVLTQTQNPLKILKILLPEKNIIIEGAEDDVTESVFKCYSKYVNKTEDYISALELIKSIKNFVSNDASKAKATEKIKSIEGILEYSNFWRLAGYYGYPSNCIEKMEKAYDLEEALKYDEAIDLLRKGLYSLPEIQESDSLRKQFLHCIAYCLRRKSVKIYNEAFDEYNLDFDKVYNNLVKFPMSLLSGSSNYGSYSSSTFCAHCFGGIYGTYYTRTIKGTKAPFCNSCNDRIDRQLKELEDELKEKVKKALDLILLSKFLSPNHNPTKIDLETIKESADKRNIRGTDISDLLLKFNLLDMPETIKLLTSQSGKKDSKLVKHLLSIIESQKVIGRTKTFDTLFNDHSSLIKDLYAYFFENEIVFRDFVVFVFDRKNYLSVEKRRDVLNDLLQMDDYTICFRLLSVLGISNDQQNFIDIIVNRLIEFIHGIISNISFDDISFKYGEPGNIIQTASQISEDLKSKCIHAIISTASKDENKAQRIISAIYEDKHAEQIFFQLLYSNDQLFEFQIRKKYYECLLAHWDANLRTKSMEWLNANITDSQAKIKYFIKSLADPDHSIQSFAHDQIKKYPEEAAGLLLEVSFANNSTQILNIRALLKSILFNLNWHSPKAISLNTLIKISLTNKDKEISQLIASVIENAYPNWTSSQAAKSCLKNIKYTAKKGEGHNSQIASELLAKMKNSFSNRLLITFSGSKEPETQAAPAWCELVLLEKEGTTESDSTISSGNADDDLFNKLKKNRQKLKPVIISGFSKICYGHHISPDGRILILKVFKEKGYKYDWDKEKRNYWDLFSLDLNSGTLKRLFYLEDLAFSSIVMLGDSCYATESSGRIVGWNWRKENNFNFINVKHGSYVTYPKRINNDIFIEEHNGTVDAFFSLNYNLKKIDFALSKGESLQQTHKSNNLLLIYKRPLKSEGWEDYDAPKSYLLVSLNDSLSNSSRKELLKESFNGEISNLDFYGDNQIIYSKKSSKDSKKSDVYIQDMDNNKKHQKVMTHVNCWLLGSKSGYILYINYNDSPINRDLIIHKVSSGESTKLLTLTGDGYRDFKISDDWSTFSYLKQTESGDNESIPCNIYIMKLDIGNDIRNEISIKTENNSYVKIEDSKK